MIERCLGRPAAARSWFARARRPEPALLDSLGPIAREALQMKRLLVLGGCLAALLAPGAAQAHPLGNFTINRHTAIELSGGRIYVQYALDLAEIPTLQEGTRVRADALRGRGRPRGSSSGSTAAARRSASSSTARFERPGAGGLKTLRFDAVYETAATGSRLAFRDRNFGSRIGWKEVVVRSSDGAELRTASVPATSRSNGLRAYPQDLLRSPLDVTTATAAFSSATARARPRRSTASRPPTIAAAASSR